MRRLASLDRVYNRSGRGVRWQNTGSAGGAGSSPVAISVSLNTGGEPRGQQTGWTLSRVRATGLPAPERSFESQRLPVRPPVRKGVRGGE